MSDELVELFASYHDDPVSFAREMLQVEPTPQQQEILMGLASNKRVSVRSGHGIGKTSVEAMAAWWFMCTRFQAIILATAPTAHQLYDNLFKELVSMYRKLPPLIAAEFEYTKDRIWHKRYKEEWYLVARTGTKDNPDALQGFHNPALLIIADEASGIPDQVFAPVEGIMTGLDNRMLMAGNPTRTSGYFYESHHKRRKRWHCLRMSSEDSPIVSKEYIDDMESEWGRDSNMFRVRVMGDFPVAEDDQFIPLDICVQAANTDAMVDFPVVWGLDPARFGGDDTALAVRHGNIIRPLEMILGRADLMHVTGWLVDKYNAAPEKLKPARVFIDEVGLGGGVVDRARELGLPVTGVNSGRASSDPARWFNLRAEMWWRFREALGRGDFQIPDDNALIGEATAPKYKFSSTGALQMESKEDMRRRGVRSPNRVDAICLTFAYGNIDRFDDQRNLHLLSKRVHNVRLEYDPLAVFG